MIFRTSWAYKRLSLSFYYTIKLGELMIEKAVFLDSISILSTILIVALDAFSIPILKSSE